MQRKLHNLSNLLASRLLQKYNSRYKKKAEKEKMRCLNLNYLIMRNYFKFGDFNVRAHIIPKVINSFVVWRFYVLRGIRN